MDWEAFFTVHRGLPREGPGTAEDVAWACGLAGLPEGAVICDAVCGRAEPATRGASYAQECQDRRQNSKYGNAS